MTFNRLNALIAHSLASPGNAESDPYIAAPAMAFACHALSTDTAFVNFDEGGDNNLMTSLEVAATIFAASIVSTADYGEISIPRGYKAAMSGPWASYWREAIDKELAGLIALRTWDLIPISLVPRGSNLMNCHYVFDVKRLRDATVEKFKARLVADGNTQKYGVDYDRIFATVVKTSTIRLVLIIAAARDYNLTQIDICQAYLQAELPEKLYMRVPPGIPAFNEKREPLVCRLNRSLYGLKQAGREWGVLFASFLISWGFIRSSIDTSGDALAKFGLLLPHALEVGGTHDESLDGDGLVGAELPVADLRALLVCADEPFDGCSAGGALVEELEKEVTGLVLPEPRVDVEKEHRAGLDVGVDVGNYNVERSIVSCKGGLALLAYLAVACGCG